MHSDPCVACHATDWMPLPAVGTTASMLSSGRIVDFPQQRKACRNCGYGTHLRALGQADIAAFYDEQYDLSIADIEGNANRSAFYRDAVVKILGEDKRYGSVIEFGCGTGDLLAKLNDRWQCRHALGLELSPQLASYARRHASVEILEASCEGYASERKFDLCLSVNVIEHASDPVAFLRAARQAITEDGDALIICPTGDVPNLELLFADHVSSFTSTAFRYLAAAAGFDVVSASRVPGNADFFAYHVKPGREGAPALPPRLQIEETLDQRVRYLDTWGRLAGTIGAALRDAGGARGYGIFGCGELAKLLHCYARPLVEQARGFVLDKPTISEMYGLPVWSTTQAMERVDAILVAVHRNYASAVAQRLESQGKPAVLLPI